MEEHIENEQSMETPYIDVYEIITFLLILIVTFIEYYYIYSSFYSPLLLFIILYLTRLIKFKSLCLDEKVDFEKLFVRTIILLCIYLYSQYTVKCIPILNLVFNELFEFPLSGKILKSFFSFIILHLGNIVINNFNYENNPKEYNSKKYEICKLGNGKVYFSLIILIIILFNTYVENFSKYIYTKKLLF